MKTIIKKFAISRFHLARKISPLCQLSIILLLTANCLLPTTSFSQTWLWAKSVGGIGGDEAYSVSTDAVGNVFITGFFSSSTITFGSTTLTNAGFGDIFIARYDSSGNVLWAKSGKGIDSEAGLSVSSDAGGNVFVTGYFDSPILTFGSTTLTNTSGSDVFIAKYDVAGNMLWAKSAGGTNNDFGWSVSADAGGDVFVTGYFLSPTITFGSTTLTNTSAGAQDLFIAKYDASGNILWAKSAGGIGDDEAYSVSADAGGNVFVTGYFNNPTITFGSVTLTNAGFSDVFIAKYDATGNILWVKSAGGTGGEAGLSLSSDASGNVFVTGYFNSPTITFGSTSLTNVGSNDLFIAKYDSSGNVLWAKSGGGIGLDIAYSVCADAAGDVFVTGGFDSPILAFGPNTLIQPLGSFDPMFIVKYDTAGNVLCASALASGGDDQSSVSTDLYGNAFIGGDFYNVNPFIVGSDTLTLTGQENVFVAKYTCDCNLLASIQGDTIVCNGGSVTLIASAIGSTNYLWSTGTTSNSVTVSPFATTTYTVIVSNGICMSDTVYKTVTVCPDYIFLVPNSFTPNGDGLNDIFLPQVGLPPNEYLLIIFDRWGNKIFETKDYKKGWDGKVKNTNTIAQEDVYVWMVKLSDFNRQQHDYYGRITLLR